MLSQEDLVHLNQRCLPAIRNLAEQNLLRSAAEVMGEGDLPEEIPGARMTEMLGAIEPLLRARSIIVSGYGSDWLWRLAGRDQVARDKLLELFGKLPGPGRLRIVQSIAFAQRSSEAIRPLELTVLRSGLRDRTPKVRLFAAQRVCHRLYFEMIPDVESALKAETNEAALRAMAFVLPLLINGFEGKVCDFDSTQYDLRVRVNGGGTATFRVPLTLVQKFGAAEVARWFRARMLDRRIPGSPDDHEPLPPGEEYARAGCWPPDRPHDPKLMRP